LAFKLGYELAWCHGAGRILSRASDADGCVAYKARIHSRLNTSIAMNLTTFFRVLILAALIFFGGRLGHLLSVPPGYASPLWPPAGIALAALLIWGRQLWPGVWLGSLLINIWIGIAAGSPLDTGVVVSAACIATGSTLQALVAVWLSHRYLGKEIPRLDSSRESFTFIALTGPLACMIAPGIGVASLVALGLIPFQAAPFSWWNWWIGDSLGSAILPPLIFCLFAHPRTFWSPRRLTVMLPLGTTLMVLMVAFFMVKHVEKSRIQLEFDVRAATIEKTLSIHIDRLMSGSFAVRDLFLSSNEVDRREFSAISKSVMERFPEIQALEWLPLVKRDQLEAFEQAARKEGYKDFRIVEKSVDGKLVPVLPRDEYFPVFFLEPFGGNEKAFGLDSTSNPLSREAKEIARQTGKPSVSQRLDLIQETGHYHAVLISIPVFAYDPSSMHPPLRGFVTGVVRPGYLIDHAVHGLDLEGMHIQLLDLDAPEQERELYSTADNHSSATDTTLHPLQNDFALANHTWQITITPDQEFGIQHGSSLPWSTLIGGLLFTCLLSTYLLTTTGSIAHTRQLIDDRTRDLQQSETKLRTIIDSEPECVKLLAMDGTLIDMNSAGLDMIEADSLDQVAGQQLLNLVLPQYRNAFVTISQQVFEGKSGTLQFEIKGLKGGHRWLDTHVVPLRDAHGKITALLGLTRDITDRKHAEEKLRLSARLFDETHEGITITNADGIIIDVNPTFTKITGYTREEAIGNKPSMLKSGRQTPEFFAAMWKSLVEEGHWKGEIWNRKKNGVIYAELLTISALRDEQGTTVNYVGLFSDITQIKQQQQTLEQMAHYDALTQLPNRVLFADRFNQAIARARRDKTQLAVCYIDLDGFKQINDSFGHEAGDFLLVEVADRIKRALREEDTVSRLGGDEFALLLGDITSLEQCEQAIDRIHQSIAEPYMINGYTAAIAASSGVTMYPQDDSDPDTLLRHADQAMYQAKLQGRNCFYFFDPTQDQQVQRHRNQLHVIEDAFGRNEFCLYYQPKVNLHSGEVIGAEALIRWKHPEQGILPPSEFLPAIADTHLENLFGNWVIEEAMNQLDQWQDAGLNLQVSINISPKHLQSPGFYAELDAALARHPKINSRKLELEVLESNVVEDIDIVSRVIDDCFNQLGVPFALDDFGTGYSSLTHMRRLQTSTVKIDQSFVRDMVDDPDDFSIVEGVIGLSKAFRREIIAEGVETIAHGLILMSMDCEFGQGYAIARPMPPEQLPGWIANWRPFEAWKQLDIDNLDRGTAQKLILRVELDQWLQRMDENLHSDSDNLPWPPLNFKKSHLGRWIAGARHNAHIDQEWLSNLSDAHERLCLIGYDLRQKHQSDQRKQARAGLRSLQSSFQAVVTILDRLPAMAAFRF
jgi:diguanylate cyclase (GGDEF)-like protein/PAS domain S-box-containing protein